ncbi:MAG: sodium:calcium symporter [Desulfobacteraceae bacterium]|nr:sodium:calcium symporter [Desulfobacteraceae bacterium]
MLTPGFWQLISCFLACSIIMIFRLNAVEKNGFEGTFVGTLVMPYFSGFPNLCFAYLLARSSSNGTMVLENCLVNNVTNLTIVLAIPVIFWGLNLYTNKEKVNDETKISLLSLLLTLIAVIFFSAVTWVLAKDGVITFSDGMTLIGIFLFWQVFHLFDVLKNNIRKKIQVKKRVIIDLFIIAFCAWGVFSSIDNLIVWVSNNGQGMFSKENLGILSGLLMVVPNAFLAVYYSAVKRPDIALSSQIGDCHICIPLCIGVFALFSPITIPNSFEPAILTIIAAALGHFFFMAFFGRLPRLIGPVLIGFYAVFIYKGVIS